MDDSSYRSGAVRPASNLESFLSTLGLIALAPIVVVTVTLFVVVGLVVGWIFENPYRRD